MKISEAVRTKKRCYRTAKPAKIWDFSNPALEHTFDGWDIAADDWELEDEGKRRLELRVAELEVELAKAKAK